MDRELQSGFYWIRFPSKEWEPAQYYKEIGFFRILGSQQWWLPHQFELGKRLETQRPLQDDPETA
jgi:hypothetical protein